MGAKIAIDRERIADFCRRHHIAKLSLFGSVLRDDFTPESDVDVLVEFEPGHVPGFLRLSRMERELSGVLDDHKIDLLTPKFLSYRIRDRVVAASEVQYAEG